MVTDDALRPGKTRAILTPMEREQIAGEHGRDRRYQAATRVRRRVSEELPTDLALLEAHHPELYAEIREVIRDGP